MIGLDTNVVVRFLVGDDPAQFRLAAQAISTLTSADPGYLSTVVLVEVYWVLTRGYKLPVIDVVATLTEVLDRDDVVTQDEGVARRALAMAGEGADFADAVIMLTCTAAGASSVLTFDRTAAKTLGMPLLT